MRDSKKFNDKVYVAIGRATSAESALEHTLRGVLAWLMTPHIDLGVELHKNLYMRNLNEQLRIVVENVIETGTLRDAFYNKRPEQKMPRPN